MLTWWVPQLDGWIVATGMVVAMACALPGAWLVLRRQSMMGDALSHAILPGLVAAFWVSGTRDSVPMIVGAVVLGLTTALLVQTLTRRGGLDEGASMGVVFTSLFAVGLVLIHRLASGGNVDIDPSCVLYGALETTPIDRVAFLGFEIPRAFLTGIAVLAINIVVLGFFHKEFAAVSFDPALAQSQGYPVERLHYLLMALLAVTTVVAFWSVGSILVIAMLIVPGAAAAVLASSLRGVLLLAMGLAAAAAITGHIGAVEIPSLLGYENTSTTGMMATMAGVLLVGALVFDPRAGYIVRVVRRGRAALTRAEADLLMALYRAEEIGRPGEVLARRPGELPHGVVRWTARLVLRTRGALDAAGALTDDGRRRAAGALRAHRLWEGYLVGESVTKPDHVHESARRLEIVTDVPLREQLSSEQGDPVTDPQQRPIPPRE